MNVQQSIVDTIDYIETLINTIDCDSIIICGDYNTSFERVTGQVNCLNDFIERNSLKVSWNHCNSSKDYTYTNYALGHKSCIDHILMSGNIYENIIKNYVD